ncbi:hypothetical protein ACFXPE_19545 [Streptomyces scopuliridis]|uniref:hypothetical protein n=1 Tax=Streptomyces scopuliridis TaxID=452529 RepID=UPI0036C755BE
MATAGQSTGQAARGGLVISCRAYFGFGPDGTSDACRVRDLTVAVAPVHTAGVLAAQETRATDGGPLCVVVAM